MDDIPTKQLSNDSISQSGFEILYRGHDGLCNESHDHGIGKKRVFDDVAKDWGTYSTVMNDEILIRFSVYNLTNKISRARKELLRTSMAVSNFRIVFCIVISQNRPSRPPLRLSSYTVQYEFFHQMTGHLFSRKAIAGAAVGLYL
ncbi:unnamed protein product [Albugo candida]|uniref:Uncharacterized protein n=1 Tax=Albugo candida TaxID=65357 RepID=A0A024GD13_9STRA|nr:unnamed protein product [Albugo candida]|eukprot:CCI44382.1 unnamed protein product [Albugo candida]